MTIPEPPAPPSCGPEPVQVPPPPPEPVLTVASSPMFAAPVPWLTAPSPPPPVPPVPPTPPPGV